MSEDQRSAVVAIIGAGPAGLYAAREFTCNGVNVVLFNKDIKPGGLAEYGIYPEKLRIKDGLRAQFKQILALDGVSYFGNVVIGEKFGLSIQDLKNLGFSAVLVTCGAQGTKWLGLPGEEFSGVYHAKEVVYYYNHLPPYSGKKLQIGRKVVVVGAGNVMADIVRYLVSYPGVEEITTIARRGPAEVKYDKKELDPIICHLDMNDYDQEIKRVSPVMQAIGQSPEDAAETVREVCKEKAEGEKKPVWKMRFLYSPVKMISVNGKKLSSIQVEANQLEMRNGEPKARGTGEFKEILCDTVIFAIGDRVNDDLGLPIQGNEFIKNPTPSFPMDGNSYELLDADHPEKVKGIFVGGWSRNASNGMVGLTRKDGTNAARATLEYLKNDSARVSVPVEKVEKLLKEKGIKFITPEALTHLEEVEKEQASKRGLPEFKFDSNEEMLKAIGLD